MLKAPSNGRHLVLASIEEEGAGHVLIGLKAKEKAPIKMR